MEELKGYDIPFEIKTLKHRADLIEQMDHYSHYIIMAKGTITCSIGLIVMTEQIGG